MRAPPQPSASPQSALNAARARASQRRAPLARPRAARQHVARSRAHAEMRHPHRPGCRISARIKPDFHQTQASAHQMRAPLGHARPKLSEFGPIPAKCGKLLSYDMHKRTRFWSAALSRLNHELRAACPSPTARTSRLDSYGTDPDQIHPDSGETRADSHWPRTNTVPRRSRGWCSRPKSAEFVKQVSGTRMAGSVGRLVGPPLPNPTVRRARHERPMDLSHADERAPRRPPASPTCPHTRRGSPRRLWTSSRGRPQPCSRAPARGGVVTV